MTTAPVERQAIYGSQVWTEIDRIPPLSGGIPPLGSVVEFKTLQFNQSLDPLVFTPVGGTSQFTNMVPANYQNNSYTPTLVDSSFKIIPYDLSVWVADCVLGQIAFFSDPVALGVTAPLTLTYYKYTGGTVVPTGNNTILGYGALQASVSISSPSSFNTVIGCAAGFTLLSPVGNTLIGAGAGSGLTNGTGNIFIGRDAGPPPSSSVSNMIMIGRAPQTMAVQGGLQYQLIRIDDAAIGSAGYSMTYPPAQVYIVTANSGNIYLPPRSAIIDGLSRGIDYSGFRILFRRDHTSTITLNVAPESGGIGSSFIYKKDNSVVSSITLGNSEEFIGYLNDWYQL